MAHDMPALCGTANRWAVNEFISALPTTCTVHSSAKQRCLLSPSGTLRRVTGWLVPNVSG